MERKIQLTGHESAVYAIAAGRDVHHILSADGNGWIVEWDLRSPDPGRLIAKAEGNIFSLAYMPDQACILAGNMFGGLHLIYPEDTNLNKNIAHHRKGIFAIRIHGAYFLTAGGDGILTKWSAEQGRTIESIQLSHQSLRSMDFCESRQELAVGSSDGNIYLLDANTFEIRRTIQKAHDSSVFSVRYAPEGIALVSGGRDAHLKVWDIRSEYTCISDQPAHWYAINDIEFAPDGRVFATGSRDKTIKIWDAATFQLLEVLDPVRRQGHIRSVNALFWNISDQLLISGSDDRNLILWTYSDNKWKT